MHAPGWLDPWVGLYRHRHTVQAMAGLVVGPFMDKTGLMKKRQVPGREAFAEASLVTGMLPDVNPALLAQFIRTTRADRAMFMHDGRAMVPPTFYVTWCMAALSRSLVKVPLPVDYTKILHAGSAVTYRRPLLVDERAHYETRVIDIDQNERRVRAKVQTIVRANDAQGEEIFRNIMDLHAPLKRGAPKEGPAKAKTPFVRPIFPFVHDELRLLEEFKMGADAGADYALVSGDFNPVHWSSVAAKASGFKSSFLQGYASKALMAHSVIKNVLRGAGAALESVQVDFRKPVFLPARFGIYMGPAVENSGAVTRELALGKAPGGEALITGSVRYKLNVTN